MSRFYEVTSDCFNGRLYLSPKPDPEYYYSFLNKLVEKKISTVVTLLSDDELLYIYDNRLLASFKKDKIRSIHFPIEDFSIPDSMERFDDLIKTLEQQLNNGNILIHCNGGLGRTGMVAVSLLCKLGATKEESLGLIRKARPGAIETEVQMEFVNRYFSYNRIKER